MILRTYQSTACDQVRALWAHGRRAVLLVAPPGSGKTEMAMALVRGAKRVLWVVHTRELGVQALERLRTEFGADAVSALMGGYLETPGAAIVVATVQSLMLRSAPRDVDLVVLDEAHHYLAQEWRAALLLLKARPRVLGLTATPERNDGVPLGDVFEELVVAASYSQLRADGHIVPVRVVAPKQDLGAHYAQHPVDAWAQWSGGLATFAFFPLIRTADMYASEWIMRGVEAQCVHSEMTQQERAATFQEFERGTCRVMSTVAAIIEGVNVPAAGAAVLGRSFEFVGGYLQATGRILRSSPGKTHAVVIDLTGATLRHGPPDQDRTYSLKGRGISGGNGGTGGQNEREMQEPEVFGVDMRVTQDAPGSGSDARPLELPPRDPKRLEERRLQRMRTQQARTQHGEQAAEEAREYFRSLER